MRALKAVLKENAGNGRIFVKGSKLNKHIKLKSSLVENLKCDDKEPNRKLAKMKNKQKNGQKYLNFNANYVVTFFTKLRN